MGLLALSLVLGFEKAHPLAVSIRIERRTALVSLRNVSKGDLSVWDPLNTEGSEMFSFRFSGTAKSVTRSLRVVVRSAGFATTWKLAPKEERTFRVDLDQLVGETVWPQGEGQLVAIVESKRSASPPVTGAWMGRVESKPVRLRW